MQQGILFHALCAPEQGPYSLQARCALQGYLDVGRFARAWQHVIARHEPLRTSFNVEGLAATAQVVHARLPLPLELYDWRAASPTAQTARMRQLLARESRRSFALAEAPLVRLALVRVADDRCRLIWSGHRLLLDRWSIRLLIDELVATYHALARQQPIPPAPARLNYVARLRQQAPSAAGAFWEQTLRDPSAPPTLADRAMSPALPDDQDGYAVRAIPLSAAQIAALHELEQQQQLAPSTLILGAWALLLSRYSGETDVSFGLGVSLGSSPLAGVEQTIGVFDASVPMRVLVPPAAALLPWLRQCQDQQCALRRYAAVPLDAIHARCALPGEQPLFESVLIFEERPLHSAPTPSPGLMIGELQFYEYPGYPLTLHVSADLTLRMIASSRHFTDAMLARLAGQLRVVLEGMLTDPQRPLAALTLLAEHERQQILVAWNDTATAYAGSDILHHGIEAQVERTPDASAVIFADQHLTYRELNQRAAQLARHLHTLGVRPESRIGICVERSVELLIGVLGILKAGGAYVPLDPGYPSERLAFMLEDSQAAVLIRARDAGRRTQDEETQPESLHDLGLMIDVMRAAPAAIANRTSKIVHADNLAYVIYTSGSTGRPKGAMNTHGAIMNRLLWMQDAYELRPDDRVLQKTPVSFDVSVWELFWPLLYGAQLVVARPGGHQDSAYLAHCIAERQITTLHFVPAMLQVFLEAPALERCTSLRRIICSGEALAFDVQERCHTRLGGVELHNLYGPTEAAVDVTFWRCRPGDARPSIPIGRPVANTQIYLLDRQLQPVGIGIPGEVYIGGVQLARGYLNRPDLTAERFVPNPFVDCRLQIADCRVGQSTRDYRLSAISYRLYKTGDLARYRPDGAIEYLGRLDHQVKLRGFRIELGEIEAALTQHPAVSAAVALVREDRPGDTRLVAYVVPRGDERRRTKDESAPSSSALHPLSFVQELRDHLGQMLPEYMVPAEIVLLDALPLTPNGKVDRRALPAPAHADSARPDAASPRDQIELQLLGLWEAALNGPIAITDSLREHGGNPALALRMAAQLQQQFAPHVPIAAILRGTTVAEQAAVLRHAIADQAQSPLVAIRPSGTRRPIFCFHPAVGNVLCYHDLARQLGPAQPIYGLRAAGLAGECTPLTRVEAMAASYVAALRTVQPDGPYLLIGYCVGAIFAFEAAQQLHRQGQAIAALVLIDGKVAAAAGSAPPPTEAQLAAWFAWELGRAAGRVLSVPFPQLRRLSPNEQLACILEQARRSDCVPADTTPAQLRQALDVFKATISAIRSYSARPYPGSIIFFRAREGAAGDLPALGWERLAEQGVSTNSIPGDHYSMIRPPHSQHLAAQLLACLETEQVAAIGSGSVRGEG
jgi:amino acid adenylation domain-containing protein